MMTEGSLTRCELGVASSDSWPDTVVLWTRLAPDPLHGGGMPPEKAPLRWRIATDDRMNKVVRQGTAVASPEWAHSVHVEAGTRTRALVLVSVRRQPRRRSRRSLSIGR
jgi:phosphodiesterase/alkaline phosphatase D-like protein